MAIVFNKVNLSNYKMIYVDLWETPYVKYLFEYGAMSKEKGKSYPSQFTVHIWSSDLFENKVHINDFNEKGYKMLPRMNQLMDYDLLITPYLYNLGDNDKWKKMEGAPEFYIKK
jgi:hypothetical protein